MLDPATVQILFADLQPPIVARSKTNPPQSLSCAAAFLAQCARLFGLPVNLSAMAVTERGDFIGKKVDRVIHDAGAVTIARGDEHATHGGDKAISLAELVARFGHFGNCQHEILSRQSFALR